MTDRQGNSPAWTPEQHRAITTIDRNILVSAAAGSGKTAVLAERCAHLVCDAKVCTADGLLVLTFTRAAAMEMKTRIERAFARRLGTGDDGYVRRQMALLDKAHVSTLHGFCGTLLRKHFDVIGIDPRFTTLDENESRLLRAGVASAVVEKLYLEDADGSFQKLIDLFFDGNDEKLRQLMQRTHALRESLVDPAAWSKEARSRVADGAVQAIADGVLGRELLREVHRSIRSIRTTASIAMAKLGAFPNYSATIGALLDGLSRCDGIPGWDELASRLREIEMPRLKPVSADQPGKEAAQKLTNDVRDLVRSGFLDRASRFSESQWKHGLAAVLPGTVQLLEIFDRFTEAYQLDKSELRALDFGDLERFALRVLSDPAQPGAPSGAARACHAQFAQVLVDEYQDNNPLQDAILRLLSHECLGPGGATDRYRPNLFCVGDVKQSIYRFRLADPGQFLGRLERYASGAGGAGEVITLAENFRSHPSVLNAINEVFSRLMTRSAAEIEYDQSHRLNPGLRNLPPLDRPAVELLLLCGKSVEVSDRDATDDEADNETALTAETAEIEAMAIAAEINRMVRGDSERPPLRILEQVDGRPIDRPVRFGDFAILLRAMRVRAQVYDRVLRGAGIPVIVHARTGFFESTEIRDMMSLLQVIDNPRQDIPLAAVIRSPLSGLTNADDLFAEARVAAGRSVEFHEAIFRHANSRATEGARSLARFLDVLDEWRRIARDRPTAELIRRVLDSTGYARFVHGLPDGARRAANLTEFHDHAREFEQFRRQGLDRFLEFLQSLQEADELGQRSMAASPENAAQVMTVHHSKGLEFPVVFVAELGKKINLQDMNGTVIVDRDAFVAPQVVDPVARVRFDSLATVVAREQIRRKLVAEELRVLYVAATRARQHLLLVGTLPGEKTLQGWNLMWKGHAGPLPDSVLGSESTVLGWIGPAACAAKESEPDRVQIREVDPLQTVTAASRDRSSDETAALATLADFGALSPPAAPAESAEPILKALQWRHPLADLALVPAARAITQLTKSGRMARGGEAVDAARVVKFTRPLPLPACAEPGRAASATEVGTVTHRVLQLLDLTVPADKAALEQALQQMVDSALIARREAALVDREAIVWFLNTPLGAVLRRCAATAFRELPIFSAVSGSEAGSVVPHTGDPLDRTMLRGQIDVLIRTADGLVLIDYKTDRVTAETVQARAAFYGGQVRAYADAVDRVCGEAVRKVQLVFLHARQIVEISLDAQEPLEWKQGLFD